MTHGGVVRLPLLLYARHKSPPRGSGQFVRRRTVNSENQRRVGAECLVRERRCAYQRERGGQCGRFSLGEYCGETTVKIISALTSLASTLLVHEEKFVHL